jgi:hypothetical protein
VTYLHQQGDILVRPLAMGDVAPLRRPAAAVVDSLVPGDLAGG